MTNVPEAPVQVAKNAIAEHPFGFLQREINRLFSSMDVGWPSLGDLAFRPITDVVENGSEIKISLELPGLEEKDLKIDLAGDMLTITGEKKRETEEKSDRRHVVERSYGAFERSIQLPQGVKPEEIDASMTKGVLTIKVKKPAAASAKPQTISVKAAA
jgi:HSP20 family protein